MRPCQARLRKGVNRLSSTSEAEKAVISTIPDLEMPCPYLETDSKGHSSERRNSYAACHECKGAGKVATEFGLKVLQFVIDNIDAARHGEHDDSTELERKYRFRI